jgi:signal transduction histidine kinase
VSENFPLAKAGRRLTVSGGEPGPGSGDLATAAGEPAAASDQTAAAAEPTAGGGEASGADDQHAWNRGGPWWDAYFAVVLAATLLIVVTTPASVAARVVAVISLVLAAVLYAMVGRPAVMGGHGHHARLGTIYMICLVVLVAVAQSQVPDSSWVLFAACPQCFMAVPLRRAVGGVVALNLVPIVLVFQPARPSRDSVVFVLATALLGAAFSVAFGSWIVRIIEQSKERSDLIHQLRAAQAELAEVSRQAGTLAERQRLAGEIHDTLAQGLTSIVMLLQAVDTEIGTDPGEARRHLELAAQTAREGLAEARAMVAALTPAHLEAGPLDEALGRLTDRIGSELRIGASFEVRGTARPLPATAEVVLLRAGQEALANVRKHAHAGDVQVVLSYHEHAVRLDVSDDGAGFDPDRVNGGYGLRGIRSRILQAGGSLLVRAKPGEGTSLSVEVPG